MPPELCQLTAVELASRLRLRQVSALEVLRAHLDHIQRVNHHYQAFVTLTPELAETQARAADAAFQRGDDVGPLCGVPVAVKDQHLVAGVRATFGSRLFADYTADRDAILVERLRRAGAVILGKTNMSEFGLIPLTSGPVWGDCRNPWNVAHNAGGSSGGSAVAVATGMASLATGSDGGGSIRVPAAFTGVFVLKPHLCRVPHVHFPPGWETLSHQGPLARTARDAARLLDVLAGPDERDRWSLPSASGRFEDACGQPVRGLRLAWSADLGNLAVDPEIASLCSQAARRFTEFGCQVDEVALDLPDLCPAQQTIVLCEAAASMADRRAEWEQLIYAGTQKSLAKADRFHYRDLLAAHWQREAYWARLEPLFRRYDALLTPTVPITAPENGSLGPREIGGKSVRALAWLGFCVPMNMTWQPAASLPVGRAANGLPVGLQLISRRFDEALLFRLASAYEAAYPQPLPPVPPV